MHSSDGCIVNTAIDHPVINTSGRFGQSLSDIKVAVSDTWFSRAWWKSKAIDYHDAICLIKVLSFHSGDKQNQAMKGVTRFVWKANQ